MIRYLYERLMGSRKPKPTRSQVLASRPVRNPSVQWERTERPSEEDQAPREPVALLKVPRRKDRMGNLAAKLFKLPDAKKIELDEIGSEVWERCDGDTTVEGITKAICAKYNLNRRQGETSVTAYLRMLAERRLVAVRTGAKSGSSKSSSASNSSRVTAVGAKAASSAVAARRRQKRA